MALPLPGPSDEVLVRRCLAGDPAAWEIFAERFSALVYFAIVHTLKGGGGRRSLPDDLVGEVHNQIFVGLMEDQGKRLGRWHGRSKLSHWIKVVSVNRTIDFLRARRHTLPLDDLDHPVATRMARSKAPGPDPEQSAMRSERARILNEAVRKLSAPDRLLVRMIFVEGLSGEEVARALGTTVGAVYTRKNRIRKRLRVLLAHRAGLLLPPSRRVG